MGEVNCVFIGEENVYFTIGIRCLLFTIPSINFLNEKEVSISDADAIFMPITMADLYLCNIKLKDRKPGSIIIGFCEDENVITSSEKLTNCISDVYLISRNQSVEVICSKLEKIFSIERSNSFHSNNITDCSTCNHCSLSARQVNLSRMIMKGLPAKKISSVLHINVKTVYSSRYSLMKKFNLKGERELVEFLKRVGVL